MTSNEFAKAVTEMLKSEKDFFEEAIQNEDWDAQPRKMIVKLRIL